MWNYGCKSLAYMLSTYIDMFVDVYVAILWVGFRCLWIVGHWQIELPVVSMYSVWHPEHLMRYIIFSDTQMKSDFIVECCLSWKWSLDPSKRSAKIPLSDRLYFFTPAMFVVGCNLALVPILFGGLGCLLQ